MTEKLAKKIRDLLYSKKITQTELSKRLGIHKQVVFNWLNGSRNPKMENLKKIATATNTPLSFFIDDSQKNFENSGIIGNNNSNNFNGDMKDIKLQLQDHEIRILKLENEMLRKELKK